MTAWHGYFIVDKGGTARQSQRKVHLCWKTVLGTVYHSPSLSLACQASVSFAQRVYSNEKSERAAARHAGSFSAPPPFISLSLKCTPGHSNCGLSSQAAFSPSCSLVLVLWASGSRKINQLPSQPELRPLNRTSNIFFQLSRSSFQRSCTAPLNRPNAALLWLP